MAHLIGLGHPGPRGLRDSRLNNVSPHNGLGAGRAYPLAHFIWLSCSPTSPKDVDRPQADIAGDGYQGDGIRGRGRPTEIPLRLCN